MKLSTQSIVEHSLPMGVLDIQHESPGSDHLLAACMDGVYRLNLASGDAERLYQHESYVSGVVFDATHHVVISAGFDGKLIWYDLAQRAVFRRVLAHRFWSWKMAMSRDGRRLATVTGQYLAGSNDYTPAPESEPSVKVYDASSGRLQLALPHVPSVHAVAFSPDSRFVAAGNLMGEVRIWDVEDGQLVANWTTDAFTSWGIIKSHCYIGGIHALSFSPDGEHLILAGMGPMRDPMAGNGRQLWQRFAWRETTARKIDETHEGEAGEGLMETLAWSPQGDWFLMGGRQRGGDWNGAIFSNDGGARQHHVSTGFRMTSAQVDGTGKRLFLAGARKQKQPKDGEYPAFGCVDVRQLNVG